MEKEGVERELRRTRKRTRFIAFILLGILLAAIGFVLLFVSTVPEGTELPGQEVFQGLVLPDTQTLVPINRTDFGWVEITGEILPCGLSFHALTVTEVERFNETNVVPQGGIDCDNPTALVQAAANHVLIWNQDGVNSLSYRVQATYFSVSQPFAWMLFPAIGLIAVGLIIVAVVLIQRD